MQLTKYFVEAEGDEEEIEEFFENLQDSITNYVERNVDISATLVKVEGDNKIEVKILKLNEHSN